MSTFGVLFVFALYASLVISHNNDETSSNPQARKHSESFGEDLGKAGRQVRPGGKGRESDYYFPHEHPRGPDDGIGVETQVTHLPPVISKPESAIEEAEDVKEIERSQSEVARATPEAKGDKEAKTANQQQLSLEKAEKDARQTERNEFDFIKAPPQDTADHGETKSERQRLGLEKEVRQTERDEIDSKKDLPPDTAEHGEAKSDQPQTSVKKVDKDARKTDKNETDLGKTSPLDIVDHEEAKRTDKQQSENVRVSNDPEKKNEDKLENSPGVPKKLAGKHTSPKETTHIRQASVDVSSQHTHKQHDTTPPSNHVLVTTPHGQVRGKRVSIENINVDVFMGLPFATAKRWQAPLPLQSPSWQGERDAREPGQACVQYGAFRENIMKGIYRRGKLMPAVEDCLFLSVYTPSKTRAESSTSVQRLPVMVWIHGGAFVEGTGFHFDGETLAALGDVVVVTINYRLGVFGFLQLAPGRTANFGLLDQLAALQWVKENIKFYGGDGTKITIFGESAGGASVGWQLLSAKTPHGLIKRAIMQSGTPNANWAWRSSEQALRDTQRLAEALECNTKDNALMESCLREKDTDCLLEAHFNLVDRSIWSAPAASIELFEASPIIDGDTILDNPTSLLQSKASLPVDQVIIGYTQEEMSFPFTTTPDMAAWAARGFTQKEFDTLLAERIILSGSLPVMSNSTDTRKIEDRVLTALTNVVKAEYFELVTGSKDDPKTLRDVFFDLLSDSIITCPSIALLKELAKKENLSVFGYVFIHGDGRLPAWAKAAHIVELDYVFGSPVRGELMPSYDIEKSHFAFSEEEIILSRLMMEFWSSFAHNGVPVTTQPVAVKDWPQFTTSRNNFILLDTNTSVASNLRHNQCLLWQKQLPLLLSVAGEPAEKTINPTESESTPTSEEGSCKASTFKAAIDEEAADNKRLKRETAASDQLLC